MKQRKGLMTHKPNFVQKLQYVVKISSMQTTWVIQTIYIA